MPGTSTSFYGTNFEEMLVTPAGAAGPMTGLFNQIHTQGSMLNKTNLHRIVDLASEGVTSPDGGTKALRMDALASSATSRYQLELAVSKRTNGMDYWFSWWEMDRGFNLTASKNANNGTTFQAIGMTHRNNIAANGPLCYNCDVTSRTGTTSRQAGVNLVGDPAHNGDGAAQRGILSALVNNTWQFWEQHNKIAKDGSGLIEFFLFGTKVHQITGQNMQATADYWLHRMGFYAGSGIDFARNMLFADMLFAPTRSGVNRTPTTTPTTPGGGTTAPAVPPPPTGLKAVASPTTQGSVVLTSDAYPGTQTLPAGTTFANFAIRWNTQNLPVTDPSWNRVGLSTDPMGVGRFAAPLSFTHTPLVNGVPLPIGTTVYYYITAVLSDGSVSAPSAAASAVIAAPSDSGAPGGAVEVPALQVDETSKFSSGTNLEAVGLTTFGGGQARLSISGGTVLSAVRRIASDIRVDGAAIEIPVGAFGLRDNAGTGMVNNRLALDWGNGNRAVLVRDTRYDTASQTPTVDRWLCVLRLGETDIGPVVPAFDVAGVSGATSPAWLKIALLNDGRTISYQVAGDLKQYTELTTRAYADTAPTRALARWGFELSRQTGDLAITTAAVGAPKGTTAAANPPSSGAPVPSDLGLQFSSPGQVRNAPLGEAGGLPLTLLCIVKATATATVTQPLGVAASSTTAQRRIRLYPASDATNPLLIEMREQSGAQTQGQLHLTDGATRTLIACSFGSDGKWSQFAVDLEGAQAGVVRSAVDFVTTTPGPALTTGANPNARLSIGGEITAIGGTLPGGAFRGEGEGWGFIPIKMTLQQFSSLITQVGTGQFVVTLGAIKSLSGGHFYQVPTAGSPALPSSTAQMLDVKNATPNNETLAERQGAAANAAVYTPSQSVTGITGSNATGTLTKTAHGLANGTTVIFDPTPTGGSGIVVGQRYVVINSAANTLQLANPGSTTPVSLGSDITAATLHRAEIPYDPASATVITPPTQQVPVPTPVPVTVTASAIVDATTGSITLSFAAPSAVAASGSTPAFTPNATPIGVYSSSDPGPDKNWTLEGAFQSATTKVLTGIPLNETRYYAIRYRDNSATPVLGEFSAPTEWVISTVTPGLTEVDDLEVVWLNPGEPRLIWPPAPAVESVEQYAAWYAPANVLINYDAPPAWQGVGEANGDGRLRTPAGAITGLDLMTRFRFGLKPVDTNAP